MEHGSVHAVPGSDLNRPAISATNRCLAEIDDPQALRAASSWPIPFCPLLT